MKNTLLFLLFCLLPLEVFGQQDSGQTALVFTHVTVIDGTGAPAKTDMTVVVKDDRIEELGETGIITVPQEAQVVDATGKFLIPGLWDMHVHPHDRNDADKKYLALFIANGITGMRVMSGLPVHHKWREEILTGKLIGPRMIISGNPDRPGSIGNDDDEAIARQFVRKIKSDGADLLKVGRMDIPHDIYIAMADEANKLGLPFAGHLPYFVTLAEASDTGLQTLEHTVFVVMATSSESEEEIRKKAKKMRETGMTLVEKYEFPPGLPYSEKKAAEIFARLVKNGTWVCPTLLVRNRRTEDDPRLKYLPLSVRRLKESHVILHTTNIEVRDSLKKFFDKNSAIVSAMNDAGVGLLAGTDTFMPGLDLQDELELLVQAGLSPMQALQTATYNAARCLGLLDSLGTVEPGKVADLVLLDANPLQDIGNTRKIAAVVVGGEIFDKPALENIFAGVEALEALQQAADDGEIEQVKLLISEGADVNAKNNIGWTPLQYAASRGHREIVELLLEHDADVNYYEVGKNQTAAEYAMNNNHTEIVQLLISKGADISPLHFAIYMKDEALARSLIEGGADVSKLTPSGQKLIRRAVFAGLKDTVELLISKGADVNDKSNWNWTLVHIAASKGLKDITELLVSAGADVNVRDGDNRTPLWYAEREGYTEIAELLLRHGAKE